MALSSRNPRVRRLSKLAGKPGELRDQGVYLIEGFTLVADALDAGVALEQLFVEEGSPTDVLAATAKDRGTEVLTVGPGGLAGIVDVVSPQPVAAIAPRPCTSLHEVVRGTDFLLILVGLADPGNVGTILRTAEAAGADGVVCATGGVDPFSPKCVRASGGAVFRVPVVDGVRAEAALTSAAAAGFTRFATVVAGGETHDAVDLAGRVALVLGNESHGLDPQLLSPAGGLVDHRITIPMVGPTESLNVAMAAAVVCFEVNRQRR